MSTAPSEHRTADATDHTDWVRPGPGTWTFDATHVTRPWPRAMEPFLDAYRSGFREGFRTIGAPLDTIECGLVNGWCYICVRPLGGPPEPKGGPPPKLAMSILFRAHPEMRRRLRTARTVLDDRTWTGVIDRWQNGERAELRDRLDRLASVAPEALGDDALGGHVVSCHEVVRDASHLHFVHAPVVALVVGDYVCRSTAAGLDAADALAALAGWSDPVRRPDDLADAVVEALAAADRLEVLEGPPDELFSAIAAAGDAPSTALAAYLTEVGPVPVGGESVGDPTMVESPALVAAVLRRRRDRRAATTSDDPRAGADARAEALAARVPPSERAAWRAALDSAREVAPLRDDSGNLALEAIGRLRLALLEVGGRLVQQDRAADAAEALELLPAEVAATLGGTDGATSAEVLAERAAARRRSATLTPPATLGPAAAPPPLDRFPAPVARVTEAAMAFISRFDADEPPDQEEPGRPRGIGIGGEAAGRAVVVDDLDQLDRFEPGDVLVARTTSPAYNVLLGMAAGVVTELGGSVCHAAVMARELDIPAVVGHPDAMEIPDGALVRVDGTTGTVTLLDR